MKKITILIIAAFLPLCLWAQNKLADKPIDIYLCIGQSNMAGRSPITDLDKGPFTNTLLFNQKNEWEVADQALNKYSTVEKQYEPQRLGVAFGFAKKIANGTEHYIGIVSNARGGTSIAWWQKGYEGENDFDMYEEAVRRTKAALAANPNGHLKAILWHQGESDNAPSKNQLYMARLKKMVDDLRTDLNAPNVPFVAGETGKWNGRGLGINPIIRQISDSIPNAYWVTSDGLTSVNPPKNDPHFDTFSIRALGGRYADKIMEIIYKRPEGGITFFSGANYEGRSVMLKAGKYPVSWLEKIGILPEEVQSIKLNKRYQVNFLTDNKVINKLSDSKANFKMGTYDTIEVKYGK